jgi:hypothetical protein
MTDESDWRLPFGDEDQYYSGLSLCRRRFRGKYPGDHEHCEFCWAKFLDEGDSPHPEDTHVIVHEGCANEGNDIWICDSCFSDFHERFSWKVLQNSQ